MGATPPTTLVQRSQRWGIALLAACLLGSILFFYTETRDQFELPKQLLLRGLSAALLGLLLWQRLREPGLGWRRGPLDLPVLAWSAWLLVGTFTSIAPRVSWRGEYENFAGSLTQLNYAFLYFAVVQLVRSREDAVFLLRCALAGALGAALYALLQAQQRDFIGWAASSVVADRFFGPLGNPNFLAGLMAMAIPLKLALAVGRAKEGSVGPDPERWSRWAVLSGLLLVYLALGKGGLLQPWAARPHAQPAAGAVLGLWLASLALAPLLRRLGAARGAFALAQGADLLVLFTALANTGTRGAFVGLMLGLAVLLLAGAAQLGGSLRSMLSLRSLAALGLLLLVLGGALLGLGPSFRTRMLATLRDPAQALETSRLQIWVPALSIWKDHPVAGSGVDSFKTLFPRYSQSRFNRYDGENVSSRMAHCEPLHVAATQGTVGLLLWAWLLAAFAAAWWARARAGGEDAALWLGVGGLVAAYLGQNLVSFGVAGISSAFWIASALPGLGSERRIPLGWRPWPAAAAALAAALVLALGLRPVLLTLKGDLAYAYASQAQDQLAPLEQAGLNELRGVAGYAYQKLAPGQPPLDADSAAEFSGWSQALLQAEQRLQQSPDAAGELTPFYRRASGSLLMLLAARSMQTAVAACPQEVKYQVYLGLAYEELFRRSQPDRREDYRFRKAAEAYTRASELNPGNAYYRGNLGRLYGSAAEAGNEAFYKPAEEQYLAALERAPVTRLFYENLLLLHARYAGIEAAGALLDRVEARDKELAPGLLIAAASTFFQWRDSGLPVWSAPRRQAAAEAAWAWGLRAQALDPGDADQAMALAIFAQSLGRKGDAQRWAAEALRLKPQDASLRDLVRQRGLAR